MQVSKQIKLRKAFTTLNKSKQAVEFEELLQQNEQAFILQNQTLAEELGKLQTSLKTLENENRQYKRQISLAPQDKAKDAELRKLQATNAALRQSLEAVKQSNHQDVVDGLEQKDEDGKIANAASEEGDVAVRQTPEIRSDGDTDSQVQILTLQEEKRLLEFELDNANKKHDTKMAEITDAMSALQAKLDQKQKSCNSLQKDINELQSFKKDAVESAKKLNDENEKLRQEVESFSSEIAVLKNSVHESQTIITQQQESLVHWQKQVDLKDEEYKALKSQNVQNSEMLEKTTGEMDTTLASLELLQKEKDELQGRYEKSVSVGEALLNQHTNLERQMEKLEHDLQQSKILTQKQDEKLENIKKYETEIENLKKDLNDALELAEKRKKLADSQSVETQETVEKFNMRIAEIESSYENKLKSFTEDRDSKIEGLEKTIKAHEDELIRAHHQERVKTREIDSLQQKINDLTAENSSLENSKGWFERALQDAEKAATAKEDEFKEMMENLKESHCAELDQVKVLVHEKEDEINAVEIKLEEAQNQIQEKEKKIQDLKRDIKDEVQKQKLVEKKVHTTLKDLKKQVVAERKKNELLQEKLKEQSAGKSNVEELLTVVDTSQQNNKPPSGGASSVSSFSFRDFITPTRSNITGSSSPVVHRTAASPAGANSTPLTAGETTDLLHRIAQLQNEKWALEEKVRHLEESGGAMADELVEKSEMVQQYVHHTRTDSVKRNGEHTTPKSLRNKVKSFVTGQEDPPQSGIGNIYELNKKLTRMLEEEMTKNIALKKDMELMAEQLALR